MINKQKTPNKLSTTYDRCLTTNEQNFSVFRHKFSVNHNQQAQNATYFTKWYKNSKKTQYLERERHKRPISLFSFVARTASKASRRSTALEMRRSLLYDGDGKRPFVMSTGPVTCTGFITAPAIFGGCGISLQLKKQMLMAVPCSCTIGSKCKSFLWGK